MYSSSHIHFRLIFGVERGTVGRLRRRLTTRVTCTTFCSTLFHLFAVIAGFAEIGQVYPKTIEKCHNTLFFQNFDRFDWLVQCHFAGAQILSYILCTLFGAPKLGILKKVVPGFQIVSIFRMTTETFRSPVLNHLTTHLLDNRATKMGIKPGRKYSIDTTVPLTVFPNE